MSNPVNRDTIITVMDAYMAMFKYLEHLQKLTHSDDLAGFLGGMSLLNDDELTADPAAWSDWIRICRRCTPIASRYRAQIEEGLGDAPRDPIAARCGRWGIR